MKKNMKSALMAAFLMVCFALAMVGGTYAYFTDTGATGTAAQVESVAGSISEPPVMQELSDKNATIVNTGNVACYIRLQVNVNFPVKYTDIACELGDNWVLGSDGNFYYTLPVDPAGNTSQIFKKLEFAASSSYDGLSITFKQECVTTTLYGAGTDGGDLTDIWEIWSHLDGKTVSKATQPAAVQLTPSTHE